MRTASPIALAEQYLVDDLPGATRPGARLHGILVRMNDGEALTEVSLAWLQKAGLAALYDLAMGTISPEEFRTRSAGERSRRKITAKADAERERTLLAERAAYLEAASKANFEKMESDPGLRRRQEARDLRRKFGVGYVEPEHYPRVMTFIKRLDSGKRISPEEFAWVSSRAEYCLTGELQTAYHRIEAEALTLDWNETGDAWAAINASAHWRKANEPQQAVAITATASAHARKGLPKIRSALMTTRGGALRDLKRFVEAKDLGLQAHNLTPGDYRPCTLLGAVSLQLGDLTSGHAWYCKAEARGAERFSVDQDIRAVLARVSKEERMRISAFLFSQDPERFKWLRGAGTEAQRS